MVMLADAREAGGRSCGFARAAKRREQDADEDRDDADDDEQLDEGERAAATERFTERAAGRRQASHHLRAPRSDPATVANVCFYWVIVNTLLSIFCCAFRENRSIEILRMMPIQ